MKYSVKRIRIPKALVAIVFGLIAFLILDNTARADVFKWVRIGRMWSAIFDSGDMSRPLRSYRQFYYNGNRFMENIAWRVAVRDWTDEKGATWGFKTSGTSVYNGEEAFDNMPVDVDGFTIRRYVRFQPPSISVQGAPIQPFFPLEGDEVNPDYIDSSGGKGADQLIESWIRTSVGITIHQKVFAFSQVNHDDYMLYDWTFKNTTGQYTTPGGLQVDLPAQTLNGVYFALAAWVNQDMGNFGWSTTYGEQEGDSLRVAYNYPAWNRGQQYDTFGNPDPTTGFIKEPSYVGIAILHVDKSVDDPTDDREQPHVFASGLQKYTTSKQHDQDDPTVTELEYSSFHYGFPELVEGQKAYYFGLNVPAEGRVRYQSRMDERKIKWVQDATKGRGAIYMSLGPFDEMKAGDDFRVVFAVVGGSLSREMRWDIGRRWKNGTLTWEGEDKIPPVGQAFPDLIPTAVDRAKDNWVATGKDSLFQNIYNAEWAVQHNYNVPKAPPPPSIEVWGRPDRVQIVWGSESESASDFAGYRVYRAVGSPDTTFTMIHESPGNTAHSFDDITAQRGVSYYYAVTAFDDGSQNQPGIENGLRPGESVESGILYNRTTEPVSLTRAPGNTLADIRVVPNPYNITAAEAGLQFPGENDKILFAGLPPECTIRIFTISGDLIKVLEHTDGSGDEPWSDLTTETRQIVVSGVYIAHVETPSGESSFVKFVIVR